MLGLLVKIAGLSSGAALGYKIWDYQRPVKILDEANVNHIVHRFLTDDRYCQMVRDRNDDADSRIISEPDFENKDENRLRYRRLMGAQRFIWCELPPDVKWYRCRMRFDPELDESIHLVWPSLEPPIGEVKNDDRLLDDIIMFSHGDGKYMILDGNHRYSQWRENGMELVTTEVYLAVSPGNYKYYPGDVSDGYHEFDPRAWYWLD